MIHPIAAKTCTEAWLQAANLLAGTTDRIAYNVILDIEQRSVFRQPCLMKMTIPKSVYPAGLK